MIYKQAEELETKCLSEGIPQEQIDRLKRLAVHAQTFKLGTVARSEMDLYALGLLRKLWAKYGSTTVEKMLDDRMINLIEIVRNHTIDKAIDIYHFCFQLETE